jgi:hypothetical protein
MLHRENVRGDAARDREMSVPSTLAARSKARRSAVSSSRFTDNVGKTFRDRFIMKFVVKAEREGAYARRVLQGISPEIWPKNATQQMSLHSRLE